MAVNFRPISQSSSKTTSKIHFRPLEEDEEKDTTALTPFEEEQFKREYRDYATKQGLNLDPDDPEHYYDYRGAWKEGGLKPDEQGHLSSKYKLEGHPRMVVDGINTKTGEQTSKVHFRPEDQKKSKFREGMEIVTESGKAIARNVEQGIQAPLGGLVQWLGEYIASESRDSKTRQVMERIFGEAATDMDKKFADAVGNKLAEWGKTTHDFWARESMRGIEAPDLETFQGSFMENPSWTRAIATGVGAIPSLAAAYAVSVTVNPFAGLSMLGFMEGSEEYLRAREGGLKPREATWKIGLPASVGTALLESIPMGRFLRGGTGRVGRDIVEGMLREGGEEVAQAFWNNMLAKVGYDSTRSLTEGMVEGFIAGGIAGGAMGGFTSGSVNRLQQEIDKAKAKGVTQEEINTMETYISNQIAANADKLEKILDEEMGKRFEEEVTEPTQAKQEMSRDISEADKLWEQELEMHAGIDLGIDKFISQDVAPRVKDIGENIRGASQSIRNFFAPESTSKEGQSAKRTIRKSMATKERRAEIFAQESNKRFNFWNKIPERTRKAFLFGMEKGNVDPRLRGIANEYVKILRECFDMSKTLDEKINYIENYFPHIWELADIPKVQEFLKRYKTKIGKEKFSQLRTVDLIKHGLALGLKLKTTNPEELIGIRYASGLRAQMQGNMIKELEDKGLIRKVGFEFEVAETETVGEKTRAKTYSLKNTPITLQKATVKSWDKKSNSMKVKPGWKMGINGELLGEGWTTLEQAKKEAIKYAERENYIETQRDPKSTVPTPLGVFEGKPEVITLINRKLTPSFYQLENWFGKSMRGALQAKNMVVAYLLNLSGFHAVEVTLSDVAVQAVITAKEVARGNLVGAAKGLAMMPFSPGISVYNGHKIQNAYLGKDAPEWAKKAAAWVERGGGRISMPAIYKVVAERAFKKAIADKNYIGAMPRAGKLMLEYSMKPILEYYVPKLKLANFYKLSSDWIEKHPDATQDQIDEYLTKTWDLMDYNFGQMVYDNLFWQRWFRDVGVLSTLSMGWNMGTLRQFGGTATDIISNIREIKNRSQDPKYVDRMLMSAAYVTVIGSIGGLICRLLGGREPEKIEDYIAPPIGEIDDEGNEVRVVIPAMTKEYLTGKESLRKHGLIKGSIEYASKKVSPLLRDIYNLVRNKDFMNVDIRDPKAFEKHGIIGGTIEQTKQVLEYFSKKKPISISYLQKTLKYNPNSSFWAKLLPFLGGGIASKSVTRTKLQKELFDLSAKRFRNDFTREEWEQIENKGELKEKFRNGTVTGQDIYEAIDQGLIKGSTVGRLKRSIKTFAEDAMLPADIKAFKYLTNKDQFYLFNKMTNEERMRYAPYMNKSLQEIIIKMILEGKK